MSIQPELINIVSDWLKERGYDGLYSSIGDCACKLDDLMPCYGPGIDCVAGYLREATARERKETGYDWFIGPHPG